MIDYKEWAQQYIHEAETISTKIEELTQQLNDKISASEKILIKSRVKRLSALLAEIRSTSILLNGRGKEDESYITYTKRYVEASQTVCFG